MDKLITKEALMSMVEKIDNAIDRFAVVGIYYGLIGEATGADQLLNIKKYDVDFNNKTITLPTGVVVMDEYLERITRDAINQDIYVKLGTQGQTSEDYSLNMDCDYIIKAKPSVKNHNGLDRISNEGFRCRLKSLSKYLGVELNTSLLKKSGALHLLSSQKSNWTVREAEKFLAQHGIKLRRNFVLEMVKFMKDNFQ